MGSLEFIIYSIGYLCFIFELVDFKNNELRVCYSCTRVIDEVNFSDCAIIGSVGIDLIIFISFVSYSSDF